MNIPKDHPRYTSLFLREKITSGVRAGITSIDGLIAHGRGEAFDYLLGEQTHDFARIAIDEAVRVLSAAKHPVLSVNGNTAALVSEEMIGLAYVLHCPLEVNIFHESKEREQAIYNWLRDHGAKTVLLPGSAEITGLTSNRRFVHPEGIYRADVVFVPLEDGDRCEALIKNGKRVITVDLNPLSRTARTASVTIVDNINRAMPLLLRALKNVKKNTGIYNNFTVLASAEAKLRQMQG